MHFEERKRSLGWKLLMGVFVCALLPVGWIGLNEVTGKTYCTVTIENTYIEQNGEGVYNFETESSGNFKIELIQRDPKTGKGLIVKTHNHHNGFGFTGHSQSGEGGSVRATDPIEIENYFQEPGTEKKETFRIRQYREIKLFRYRDPKYGWIEYILRVQPK